MDAFVTARVPVELKEQVNRRLTEIGSSQSQLVNAAYLYVLKEGKLPEPSQDESNHLIPTADQLAQVDALLEATTFAIPEAAIEDMDYRKIIEEGKLADYEAGL